MSTESASHRAERLRLFSTVAGTVVMVEGILVLGGWALGVDALKSVLPGLATMKPNTAIAFVLAGFLLRRQTARSETAAPPRYFPIVAFAVAALALATLLEQLLHLDFGIDTLLFRDSVLAERTAEPGRMAPLTTVSLLLLALALWLSGGKDRRNRIAELIALVVALVSLVALTGYVYGVRSLYAVRGFSSTAVHTALSLLLLALGVLAAHPARGLASLVTSDGPGGRAARRILPAAVALPFLLGWLRLQGERANLYDTAFGVSVLVLALVAVFSAVIVWNARSLDRVEGERLTAEEATREKGRFLQLILDRMTDGVVVADAEGHFLVFNPAAEEVLGMGAAEVAPGQWSEHYGVFLDDAQTPCPPSELPLARAIRGEEVSGMDLVVRHARRPEGVWLRVSARPLQDPRGVLQGGMALFSDVTERRRLEEARRRAQEMEADSRRAQEASRLKSEFLANMSHELRTPLNAVIGFAEILHDAKVGPVNADQKEFLGDILSSSRHLLQLINDVLDLSKVEAGKMEFRPERVDMTTLVGEVRDILRSIAAGKRIQVETEIAGALGEVVIDPGKLKQVLYNYLSNALKFTPEGGHVTIRVRPEGAHEFRLEVEDTGIGIQPADLERLFVEFQQLDASAAKRYAGTGLGLALTRRLAEAQGGRTGALSAPGQGSVFYAIFPRVALVSTTVEACVVGSASPGRQGPSVLVVEDDKGEREWLLAALTRAGYVVEAVATGAEAMTHANERRYDAITLDMLLPDTNGRDVLAALRAQGPNVDTPVIVLTVVAERGIFAGLHVQEILAKPVSEEQLVASITGARATRPDGGGHSAGEG